MGEKPGRQKNLRRTPLALQWVKNLPVVVFRIHNGTAQEKIFGILGLSEEKNRVPFSASYLKHSNTALRLMEELPRELTVW
ncbi:MAG: hypothetical protein Ct9H300mP11_09400 [Chloroflexota bacterium]|nr:MAG: hypothetical protein Ct9H300mP11_09400 [Chloroflexota bacterium]